MIQKTAANQLKEIAFPNIQKLTEGFTGRSQILNEINHWLQQRAQRFFILCGEPGVGKSAISDRPIQFSFSTEPLHSELLLGFLSTVHRCSDSDSLTVDPKSFA